MLFMLVFIALLCLVSAESANVESSNTLASNCSLNKNDGSILPVKHSWQTMQSSSCGCGFAGCSNNQRYCATPRYSKSGTAAVCITAAKLCSIDRSCSDVCSLPSFRCSQYGTSYAERLEYYLSSLQTAAAAYGGPKPLTIWQKKALSCSFPTLNLDAIRVYYNVQDLPRRVAIFRSNDNVNFAQTNVKAVTIGYHIFLFNAAAATEAQRNAEVRLLMHELARVEQAVAAPSLTAWATDYGTQFCRAGFDFGQNIYELAANARVAGMQSCSDPNGVWTCMRDMAQGTTYLAAVYSTSVNRFQIKRTAACDDSSTWLVQANGCIRHAVHDGYLSPLSSTSNDLSLLVACNTWAQWTEAVNSAGQMVYKNSANKYVTFSTSLVAYALSTTVAAGFDLDQSTSKFSGFAWVDNYIWTWCVGTGCANSDIVSFTVSHPPPVRSSTGSSTPQNPDIQNPDDQIKNPVNAASAVGQSLNAIYFVSVVTILLLAN